MGGDVVGYTGTSTATSATTLTATGTPFAAGVYVGHMVVTGSVYGVVTGNTTSVLTIDQWYTPGTPGGAAASTPATGVFVILPGQAPSWYLAITTNATGPSATDTTLTSEIATAGGGLIRKLATYAHTATIASYTLTATFTVNASDTGLPVTIAKLGIFNTLVGATGRMQFETAVSPTAVLSAIGDSLTLSETVSM